MKPLTYKLICSILAGNPCPDETAAPVESLSSFVLKLVSPQIDSVAASSSRLVDHAIEHYSPHTFPPQLRKNVNQVKEHRSRNSLACPILSAEGLDECHGNGFATQPTDEEPRGGVVYFGCHFSDSRCTRGPMSVAASEIRALVDRHGLVHIIGPAQLDIDLYRFNLDVLVRPYSSGFPLQDPGCPALLGLRLLAYSNISESNWRIIAGCCSRWAS